MQYYQGNIPSPNQSTSFTLQDFVGGLNNRSQSPMMNQGMDMMNMNFTSDGFIQKRNGVEYFDEVNVGGEMYFMDTYRPYTDEPRFIRATRSELYVNDSKVLDLEGEMMGTTHSGRYYFVDTKSLYVYAKFDAVANTYTEVIGTQPTDYSVLKVVAPPEVFVPLPVQYVTGKTVYDYDDGTIHYEPCLNEIEDTNKGSNYVPENPAYIIHRDGRLYVSGCELSDDTIFISDLVSPIYYPNVLSLQLPPNSDKIRGLCLYNDTVLVGRTRDIYVINGKTNNNAVGLPLFTLQQLSAHTGVANQRTFISAHNYTFFLGTDGQFYVVRSLDTSSDTLATTVISKDIDLSAHPIGVTYEDYFNSSACFFNNSYYVTIGDKVLIYNYLLQAWSIYNQINATSLIKVEDKMYFGTKFGRTLKSSENYLDLGKPYKAYWLSRYLDMADSSSFKFFREFFVVARTFDEFISDIRFVFEIDYSETGSGVIVRNQISVWGKARFGDRFINKNINATEPFQIGQRGRMLRVYYENSYDVTGEVATHDNLSDIPHERDSQQLYYVVDEGKYYLLDGLNWVEKTVDDLNQPMRVTQISGFYEKRGRRY